MCLRQNGLRFQNCIAEYNTTEINTSSLPAASTASLQGRQSPENEIKLSHVEGKLPESLGDDEKPKPKAKPRRPNILRPRARSKVVTKVENVV